MKKFGWLCAVLFFMNCNKSDDCITIIEKRNVGENYYFLFEDNRRQNSNQTNQEGVGSLDPYASGEVNESTYNTYQVGDRYCY